ncbi:hypothetical protein [Nannocystis pusilla]
MPPVQSSQNATGSTVGAPPFTVARSPASTSARPPAALTIASPSAT